MPLSARRSRAEARDAQRAVIAQAISRSEGSRGSEAEVEAGCVGRINTGVGLSGFVGLPPYRNQGWFIKVLLRDVLLVAISARSLREY